jgi:hypothetical protein
LIFFVGLPHVASVLNRSSAVVHEVPLTLKSNNRIIHAEFELDGGCDVELLISDAVAASLGFDQLDADQFKPYDAHVGRGADADFREYLGMVEVSFTTGRGSVRMATGHHVLVGGNNNLIGRPTMGRLGIGVPDAGGIVCIFPLRAAKMVD